MSLTGHESHRLEYLSYVGNQQAVNDQIYPLTMPEPVVTGGPITIVDSPSPGSSAATPSSASKILEAAQEIDTATQLNELVKGAVYREATTVRGPSLPRIIPPEDKATLLMQGQLPPLATETIALRPAVSPPFKARRSQSEHASFLSHDASKSSISSRSSNISSASTPLSPITPVTPVEEIRSKRALLLPLPLPPAGALIPQFVDQTKEPHYLPKPAQPNQAFDPAFVQTSQYSSSSSTGMDQNRSCLEAGHVSGLRIAFANT